MIAPWITTATVAQFKTAHDEGKHSEVECGWNLLCPFCNPDAENVTVDEYLSTRGVPTIRATLKRKD